MGIYTYRQHEFRKGRNCLSQLLKHSEEILDALQDRLNIDSVYLDFQKAFDKTDFGLIGVRCKEKGITGHLGAWIQDYLHDRIQFVIANNVKSREEKVRSGVPQGSVLGPLLFLIVIDSIANLDISSKIGIFADDTRAVKSMESLEDAKIMQNDLDILYDWANYNNMAFNNDKFECLKYGSNHNMKSEYSYESAINGEVIKDCNDLRDLGITMSADGTYDAHITKVITKAKQKVAWVT